MVKGLDPALIGRTVAGKFLIESFIGSGAMGAVYKAKQVALDKTVAIKVLHRELTSDESFTARFKREAKAASRLDHPNSVRVLDFGNEPDGLLYIAMEHLDGRDLLQVTVEDWPLSSQRIAHVVTQALAALAVAHDMGVVHRDLKPENIMILKGVNDEGLPTDVVKVCDFGIAKMTQQRTDTATDGGGPLTAQGLVVGTPEYMSPEQGKGETLDPRSDLYSMGVILYQLLTGRVPFEAESALGIVFKHVTEPPVPPSLINPVIDRRLEAICLKAMSKRREDRPQSAREMRADFRTLSDASVPIIVSTAPRGSEPADTIPLPALADGLAAPPDPLPKTTSSATFLDAQALPRSSTSPLLLGVATALLGAVVAAAFLMHRRPQASGSEVVPEPVVASAEPLVETPIDARAEVPSLGSAAATGSAMVPAHPVKEGAPSSPPRERSRAIPAPPPLEPTASQGANSQAASYNLAVASATPTVLSAIGASPRDVRSALPSVQFTLCYRDAMKRSSRRLEGKMSVHIKIGLDGKVVTARISAPESLAQAVGTCVTDSFNGLAIPAASGAGGEADLSIAFVPN